MSPKDPHEPSFYLHPVMLVKVKQNAYIKCTALHKLQLQTYKEMYVC